MINRGELNSPFQFWEQGYNPCPNEDLMLFSVLLIALLASAWVSNKLSAGASARRTYAGFLWSLILGFAVTGWWFLRRYHAIPSPSLWQLMALVFHDVCFTFPLIVTGMYAGVMLALKRKGERQHVPTFLSATILLAIPLGLMAIGIYASRIEPNQIEVTRIDLESPKVKGPIKIVHLTDLHMEKFGRREKKALRLVKEEDPDLIVLTGDYTNSLEKSADVQRFMKELHAKYGVYAVHGNWNPREKAKKFFERTDVRVLDDRSTAVRTPMGRVSVAGIFWYSFRHPGAALANVNPRNSYVILLSHMPDAALHAPPSVDLILAGHTHGGQVRLPGIGPVVTFSGVGRAKSAGLSKLESGGYLYVNRGLGMEGGGAPRIRFCCRPEVAVITIRPSEQ